MASLRFTKGFRCVPLDKLGDRVAAPGPRSARPDLMESYFLRFGFFRLFWHDFRLNVSDFWTPPRGAPGHHAQSHWFYKVFEDFGRLRRAASRGRAVYWKLLRIP